MLRHPFLFVLVLGGALVGACSAKDSANPIAPADASPVAPTETDADVEADAKSPATGDGLTGSPCAVNEDCKGSDPVCILAIGKKEFPGGYCAAACDPSKNDSAGRNSKCPGTNAVCESQLKRCLAGCTEKQGSRPCRADYLCAFAGSGDACLPTSYSECDLTKRGDCGAGKTCMIIGLDPIGKCETGCDIFAQDCGGPDAGPGGGCYPTALGEGHCVDDNSGGKDGDTCLYVNDCAPGLSCNDEGSERKCRPLCGGPSNVTCKNGKTCVDLSTDTPASVAGVCAG
jgi:hypothetical protein